MTASMVYIAYIQACWAVVAAVMVAVVLAMLVGVVFLGLLGHLARRWFA